MYLDAGELRHRVYVLGEKENVNQLGQIILERGQMFAVWAKVTPNRANEQIKEEKMENFVFYKIIVRYNPNIKEYMYLMWKDKELEIVSISDVDGFGYAMEILAKHEVEAYE